MPLSRTLSVAAGTPGVPNVPKLGRIFRHAGTRLREWGKRFCKHARGEGSQPLATDHPHCSILMSIRDDLRQKRARPRWVQAQGKTRPKNRIPPLRCLDWRILRSAGETMKKLMIVCSIGASILLGSAGCQKEGLPGGGSTGGARVGLSQGGSGSVGLPTGGTPGTGGIAVSGGIVGAGGSVGHGGASGSGGWEGPGGAPASGSAFAAGGVFSSGGARGTGGMVVTGGGVVGGSGTGGRIGTGGTVASGGAGGVPGTGGTRRQDVRGLCRSCLSGWPVLRHADRRLRQDPDGAGTCAATGRIPCAAIYLPGVRMRRQDLRQRLPAPGRRRFHGLAGRVPSGSRLSSRHLANQYLAVHRGPDLRIRNRPAAGLPRQRDLHQR
jgi:hypothetical protein